jgi:hypothetical protein
MMDEPTLPSNIDVSVIRRYKCEMCGRVGGVRRRCRCGHTYFDNFRALQFVVRK